MFGDFGADGFDSHDWGFFTVSSFATTIVMMNLLIAIISDRFEQVMNKIQISQYKELCEVILE